MGRSTSNVGCWGGTRVSKGVRFSVFLCLLGSLALAALGFLYLQERHTPRASHAPPTRPYSGESWGRLVPPALGLRSAMAIVQDQTTGEILYEKEADRITPIASITKLMTAMVLLDARLTMTAPVTIIDTDVDTLKNSLSHLPVGWMLTREDLLHLALMSSENRAAGALARTFPGGTEAFVAAMNSKAAALGMAHTHFVDPHGLHPENVSTARELLLMAGAAYAYEPIRRMTTSASLTVVALNSQRSRTFGNSDYLVTHEGWTVGMSKTGYIVESGYCLVLQATILNRPVLMVFLNRVGKHTRMGDAARTRAWLEASAQKGGR